MRAERLLLDTNAWTDLMRGERQVAGAVRGARRIVMSSIVVGELEYGFRAGSRTDEDLARLDDFLESPVVRFLYVTRTTADRFGRTMATLRAAGTPIPTNDVWIAAHVLETGATLATRDRHFEAIPGLPVLWLG